MQLDKNKVKLIMAKKELSITKIAERAGVTKQRVSCIFNTINLAPKTVGMIARALEVEPEEIIETEN